jgi:hypothetical protein
MEMDTVMHMTDTDTHTCVCTSVTHVSINAHAWHTAMLTPIRQSAPDASTPAQLLLRARNLLAIYSAPGVLPPPAGIHTGADLSLSSSEEKDDSAEDSDSTHSSLSLSCDVAGTAFAAKSLASLNRSCPSSPLPPSAPLLVWSSPACCCRAGVSLAYSAGDRTVRTHSIALGMGMQLWEGFASL